MQRRSSKSSKALALLVALAAWGSPVVERAARAQACCAGGSAITPGRLQLHEDALVGMELKAATLLGTYDTGGRFIRSPLASRRGISRRTSSRPRASCAADKSRCSCPSSRRSGRTPTDGGHFGGGIGDVNLSARYDFVARRASPISVPGVAAPGGHHIPHGQAARAGDASALVDDTGRGAFQGNVALALEQTYGPWLFNATGLVAFRSARFGEQLAPQGTLLAAAAYTLPNDMALALSASYAFEGEATYSDGTRAVDSSKRVTVVTLSGFWPVTDTWRLLAGILHRSPGSTTWAATTWWPAVSPSRSSAHGSEVLPERGSCDDAILR